VRKTRSRCSLILLDQSAEKVMTADGSRCACVVVVGEHAAVWRGEPESTVRPVPVVVRCVHAQNAFEMSASEDEDAIEAVLRTVRTQRSAFAFAFGA
jgi:hypothetical protein